MSNDYRVIGALMGMLILISPRYGEQVWASRRSRKRHQCLLCQLEIRVGSQPYSPITNLGNRMDRLCEQCAIKAMSLFIAHDTLEATDERVSPERHEG